MKRIALVALALVLGCAETAVLVSPDAELVVPDATVVSGDDGGTHDPSDAGVAPDAAPSRLTHRPLLGALAIDNRWFDPMADVSTFHWALDIIDGTASSFELFDRMRREAHCDVPTGAPVLHVRRGREGKIALITEGLADGRPLDARVWVGRRIDQVGDPPKVSLIGTTTTGAEAAADLVVTATVVARTSGVEWTRYEGRWGARPIGQVLLSIEDTVTGGELFVSGPELVDVRQELRLGPPRSSARDRPLTPRDQAARAAIAALHRRPRPDLPRAPRFR